VNLEERLALLRGRRLSAVAMREAERARSLGLGAYSRLAVDEGIAISGTGSR